MSKQKVRIIVQLHGGNPIEVLIDNPNVEVTDVVFTENTKYSDNENEFIVKGGECNGDFIYSHLGPILTLSKKKTSKSFRSVFHAATLRIKSANTTNIN